MPLVVAHRRRSPTPRGRGRAGGWGRGQFVQRRGGSNSSYTLVLQSVAACVTRASLLGFLRRQSRATTVLHHTAPRAALYPARVPEAKHSSNPRSRPLRGPGVLKESRQD